MSKTPVTYRETLHGALEVQEIERVIMDNLIQTQKFLFRNFKKLSIDEATAKRLHELLAGNLFEEAGIYRRHNVQLGGFEPPNFFDVPVEMKS